MNVIMEVEQKKALWFGKTISQIFGAMNMALVQQLQLTVGRCPVCEQILTQADIKPAGRVTERAFHQQCYQELIRIAGANCLICGNPRERDQLQAQAQFPGDVHHMLHPAHLGHCKDLFCLISYLILGYDSSFLLPECAPDFTVTSPLIQAKEFMRQRYAQGNAQGYSQGYQPQPVQQMQPRIQQACNSLPEWATDELRNTVLEALRNTNQFHSPYPPILSLPEPERDDTLDELNELERRRKLARIRHNAKVI